MNTASGGLDDTSVVVALVTIYVIIGLVSLLVYFVPFFLARKKKKENFWAIFALNFFLGWSVFGGGSTGLGSYEGSAPGW